MGEAPSRGHGASPQTGLGVEVQCMVPVRGAFSLPSPLPKPVQRRFTVQISNRDINPDRRSGALLQDPAVG